MCGQEGELFKAVIEGTELTVCDKCARYGKIITPVRISKGGATNFNKGSVKDHYKVPAGPELILSVVPNYGEIIKKKREQLNLPQEDFAKQLNERTSLIHKMETGSFKPSLDLARKLEKLLKVKLVEQIELKEEKTQKTKSDSFTIGDLLEKKILNKQQ